MAHELAIATPVEVASTFRTSPAWHAGATTKVFNTSEHATTAQMLSGANLADWNVRLEPLVLPDGYVATTNDNMVVRDNPVSGKTEVMAVVGDRYKVVQNEALFDFGDAILDGGATWDSAGNFKNGKTVFGSLVVPREFILDEKGANDKTVTYLLVSTSHDGSSSVSASITPIRVYCQNTLNLALKTAKQQFKIRHTQTVEGRIATAREALGLTFGFMDEFETMARKLYETSITDAKFDKLVASLYPAPADGSAKVATTRYDSKVDLITDLYRNGATNQNIKGTAWGALNALTEYIDYYRTGRGENDSIIGATAGFDPVVNNQKNDILEAVLALV